MSTRFYTLIGQTPTPCQDVLEWAEWLEHSDRQVSLTVVGRYRISTVFLALNHRLGDGEPLLFETIVFDKNEQHEVGFDPGCIERCATWIQAERQHERAVRQVEASTGLKRNQTEVTA